MPRHSPHRRGHHFKAIAVALWCICSLILWTTFFSKSTADMLGFKRQKAVLSSYQDRRPVLFHILTTHQGLAEYFYGHTEEWLAEV